MPDADGRTPLSRVAGAEPETVVKLLLEIRGVDPNAKIVVVELHYYA